MAPTEILAEQHYRGLSKLAGTNRSEIGTADRQYAGGRTSGNL